MTPVTTISQLNALITSTYMYALLVACVAVTLAFFLANLLPWEGGADRSYIKRRWLLFVVGLLAFVAFFLLGDLYIAPYIKNSGFQAMYRSKLIWATIGELLLFCLLSFILMLIMRNGKFGSILGKQNK